MENLIKSLDSLAQAIKTGDPQTSGSESVNILIALGDKYSKEELDGGNDPEFTLRWNKVKPYFEEMLEEDEWPIDEK